MLTIYSFIAKSWFGTKNRTWDNQKGLTAFKVSKGIPEAFSEPWQTFHVLAQYMKNLGKKLLITHLILKEYWMLATCCKALVLLFYLSEKLTRKYIFKKIIWDHFALKLALQPTTINLSSASFC